MGYILTSSANMSEIRRGASGRTVSGLTIANALYAFGRRRQTRTSIGLSVGPKRTFFGALGRSNLLIADPKPRLGERRADDNDASSWQESSYLQRAPPSYEGRDNFRSAGTAELDPRAKAVITATRQRISYNFRLSPPV